MYDNHRLEMHELSCKDEVHRLMDEGEIQRWLLSKGSDNFLAQLKRGELERGSYSAVLSNYREWEKSNPRGPGLEVFTHHEFAEQEYGQHWLVNGLLHLHQPTILAGPRKSLKTTIATDLAISVALRKPFLQTFPCGQFSTICFLSAESGEEVVQETARRVARSHGVELDDSEFSRLHWCFEAPNLSDTESLINLESQIRRRHLSLLILDPAYLLLPNSNPANMFAMGDTLKRLGDICYERCCTPVLCHHTRKGTANSLDPLDLDDITWSGFAEWTRQWLILSRRIPYDANQAGSHRLWLSFGGAAGQSGLVGLNIEEGAIGSTDGRHWSVEVVDSAQTLESDAELRLTAEIATSDIRKRVRTNADCRSILRALDKVPAGDTATALAREAGVSGSRSKRALSELERQGTVQRVEIRKGNRRKPYVGYALATQISQLPQIEPTGQPDKEPGRTV